MIRKILLGIGATIVLVVVVVLVTINVRWDRQFEAPYPQLVASTDPAVVARGRYLAYGPAHCAACHAQPGNPTSPLSGGRTFVIPPGTIRVPNLTPDSATGIGRFTDAAIARMLRYGVRHDGRSAIPFMEFQAMSDADIVALLSFLRSQPAVRNEIRDHDYTLLGKAVMSFAIQPIGPSAPPPAESPPPGPTVERGAYLVDAISNCAGCHTERSMSTGAFTGPKLAGGTPMETESDKPIPVVPPNLTADSNGRAALWTEDEFVARFRAGERIPGSPMPWVAFGRMSDDDLRAIYRYLRTVRSAT
jgi:mono/diheme cytochrome c family protein